MPNRWRLVARPGRLLARPPGVAATAAGEIRRRWPIDRGAVCACCWRFRQAWAFAPRAQPPRFASPVFGFGAVLLLAHEERGLAGRRRGAGRRHCCDVPRCSADASPRLARFAGARWGGRAAGRLRIGDRLRRSAGGAAGVARLRRGIGSLGSGVRPVGRVLSCARRARLAPACGPRHCGGGRPRFALATGLPGGDRRLSCGYSRVPVRRPDRHRPKPL